MTAKKRIRFTVRLQKIDIPCPIGQPWADKMDSSREVSLSLIIPCWHDVEVALELGRLWSRNALVREVIIAGVSGHAPSSIVEGRLKFCSAARPGRGSQFNLGARAATGDVLLFHHVDSQLTEAH